MALPPGTSGWVGSGFDCTCDCNFVAGFAYNGDQPAYWGNDPPSICSLIFAVGNVTDGCDVVDIETADLVIDLELNGSPITATLITDTVNNVIYWDTWKPTAGDVYTATVTLTCGATVTTREYSFTIPDPANTACVCCDDRIPDYVVVSGLTGDCCDFANGTYSLSNISTCIRSNTVSYSAPATGDRCNAAVACDTVTLATSGYFGGPFDIAYLHKASVTVSVGVGRNPLGGAALANANEIRVVVDIAYFVYRERVEADLSVTCTLVGGFGSRWVFNSICSSDLSLYDTDSNVCSPEPTVELYFQ